jgi:hypothetical protein
MRIETRISDKYLAPTASSPGWGAREGRRELLQNGIDAQVEHGAALTVDLRGTTLRIENKGVVLAREALLLGTSTKGHRTDLIGKFGEGLKLGILALVRAGHDVKIRTGGEVWTAAIERSERYDANVLCFHVHGGNEDKRRVRVEVSGVSPETWAEERIDYLFLAEPRANEAVKTDRGTLLLGEQYRGRVYVKGIWVQDDPRLTVGYDLMQVDLDRDRRMLSSWNLSWETSQIWNTATATRPDIFPRFFELLQRGAADVSGIEHTAAYATPEIQRQVAEAFQAQFGAAAVPVSNLAESMEVEHLGRQGVVVNKPFQALLAKTLGDKETIQRALREEVTRTLSAFELTAPQRTNLVDAVELVRSVRPDCTLDLIDLVEFRSRTLLGQHKDGRILLAAKLLDDPDELLATLVHEFAHQMGGDGEKGHVAAIEDIWRDIVRQLRQTAKERDA